MSVVYVYRLNDRYPNPSAEMLVGVLFAIFIKCKAYERKEIESTVFIRVKIIEK